MREKLVLTREEFVLSGERLYAPGAVVVQIVRSAAS